MQAPPIGYLEIERALRLLELGESEIWVAGKLHDVDHPAAAKATRAGNVASHQAGEKANWNDSTP